MICTRDQDIFLRDLAYVEAYRCTRALRPPQSPPRQPENNITLTVNTLAISCPVSTRSPIQPLGRKWLERPTQAWEWRRQHFVPRNRGEGPSLSLHRLSPWLQEFFEPKRIGEALSQEVLLAHQTPPHPPFTEASLATSLGATCG